MRNLSMLLACLLALVVGSPLCCCALEKAPSAPQAKKEEVSSASSCCCCEGKTEKQSSTTKEKKNGRHACLCAAKEPKQISETPAILPPADAGMDLPPVHWVTLLAAAAPEIRKSERDPRLRMAWTAPPPGVRRAMLVSRTI